MKRVLTPKGSAYRRDIDGLRALAIVPVVLFHAGVPGFGGGFIGVDVFFVISGFLITSLIAAEIDEGRFSLLEFYDRRVRRIAPALILVTAVTLLAGWFLLMPEEYSGLASSAIAALLSFANFHFWMDSDYFSTAVELKPLLHTWSLSVEEQFYLVFPLLLVVLMRATRGHFLFVVIAIGFVSFVASSVLTFTHPEQAFYAPWSRAFELLLGSVVALMPRPASRPAAVLEAMSIAGLAMIALPVASYTGETPFPGIAALVPAAGTALLIHAGRAHEGPVQALLGLSLPVGLGLVSYSLYLWHWPVLVFWKIAAGAEPGGWATAGLITLLVPLSVLSWAAVERPFRNRTRMGRRTVFTAVAAVLCAVVASAAGVIAANGMPGRLPGDVRAILAVGEDVGRFMNKQCFVFEGGGPTPDDIRSGTLCRLGKAEGPVSFLFIGDSHAGSMARGIDAAAKRHGLAGLFVGHASCPPILDYQRSADAKHASCKLTNAAAQDLVAQSGIPYVLMTARWARYVNGTTFGNDGPLFDPSLPIPSEDHSSDIAPKLENTLMRYLASGSKPVLIADVPEVGYDIVYESARSTLQGHAVDLEPPVQKVVERQRLSMALLGSAARRYGLPLITPATLFCDSSTCKVRERDKLLYRDEDHLSEAGALFVSQMFDPLFTAIATGQQSANSGPRPK